MSSVRRCRVYGTGGRHSKCAMRWGCPSPGGKTAIWPPKWGPGLCQENPAKGVVPAQDHDSPEGLSLLINTVHFPIDRPRSQTQSN
ncbi:hypothetical protein AAFF_G00124170 [Aldrovandia affinis]|uniref:Uncharacterized protein n=1 Tax=Aldrovandia affinis TaxID=143900 RepID=A0AAD7RRQ1_9TELE|nr:hypothetical protein AAFF_G00124170 [Aldrovandia affinis]